MGMNLCGVRMGCLFSESSDAVAARNPARLIVERTALKPELETTAFEGCRHVYS
jgi:hypothetical protein